MSLRGPPVTRKHPSNKLSKQARRCTYAYLCKEGVRHRSGEAAMQVRLVVSFVWNTLPSPVCVRTHSGEATHFSSPHAFSFSPSFLFSSRLLFLSTISLLLTPSRSFYPPPPPTFLFTSCFLNLSLRSPPPPPPTFLFSSGLLFLSCRYPFILLVKTHQHKTHPTQNTPTQNTRHKTPKSRHGTDKEKSMRIGLLYWKGPETSGLN